MDPPSQPGAKCQFCDYLWAVTQFNGQDACEDCYEEESDKLASQIENSMPFDDDSTDYDYKCFNANK